MRNVLVPVSVYITILVVLLVGLGTIGYHLSKQSCTEFARASNRETKFVNYSVAQWDCLTPQENGKWISVYLLRGDN